MNDKNTILLEDENKIVSPLPPLRELKAERLVTQAPSWAQEQSIIKKLKQPGRPVITGGIGAGKSVAAEIFERLGAAHIDFDILSRRVVEPETDGFAAVVNLLGSKIVNKGVLDRAKIAAFIYADPEIRKRVEDIIHPRIWTMMGKELDNVDDNRIVVISVPLLFEAGLDTFFKPIILIYADAELRLKRLAAREKDLDASIAKHIMDIQWPDSAKILASHYVINNNKAMAHIRHQAHQIYLKIEREIKQAK